MSDEKRWPLWLAGRGVRRHYLGTCTASQHRAILTRGKGTYCLRHRARRLREAAYTVPIDLLDRASHRLWRLREVLYRRYLRGSRS